MSGVSGQPALTTMNVFDSGPEAYRARVAAIKRGDEVSTIRRRKGQFFFKSRPRKEGTHQ